MDELIKEFLACRRFAVAGSFRDEAKVAFRVYRDLLRRGYEAFPVNPGLTEVDGRPCYRQVGDIPGGVEVVNLVTPPAVTRRILAECLGQGVTRAWLQPGAEDAAVLDFCRVNGIRVVHGVCVMLAG